MKETQEKLKELYERKWFKVTKNNYVDGSELNLATCVGKVKILWLFDYYYKVNVGRITNEDIDAYGLDPELVQSNLHKFITLHYEGQSATTSSEEFEGYLNKGNTDVEKEKTN